MIFSRKAREPLQKQQLLKKLIQKEKKK